MEKPSTHVMKKDKRITFKVQKQHDEDMYLMTRRDVPLGKVLRGYCEKLGLIYECIRFTHDGRRVKSYNTPNDLEMEDDDVIDAWNEQLGGAAVVLHRDSDD